MKKTNNKSVMIIAGEASGDLHGAKLVNAMREKNPALSFCGIGGQALRDAGVKILVDASELSVVGITEVFSKIPGIFKGISAAKSCLRNLRPDLLILIDFPDFNLRIAATAKRLGISVLYYISPQIWAWRSGRVKKIGRLVDHMAVILPFEASFYRRHKIPVTFVGHPLLDTKSFPQKPVPPSDASDARYIGLLPGSRDGEVAKHLPVMLEAAQLLSKQHSDLKFMISLAPSADRQVIEDSITSHFSLPISHFSFTTGSREIFAKCSFAIAASGTVTLETAIAGIPMVIIYKVSPVSYRIGKAMIRVKHISLVNLIAGRGIVPELIQHEASPENIANVASGMLACPGELERLRAELLNIRNVLGGEGASARVADIAVDMLMDFFQHSDDES